MFLNQNLFQQLTRPNMDLECREYVQLKRNIYSADIFNPLFKKINYYLDNAETDQRTNKREVWGAAEYLN